MTIGQLPDRQFWAGKRVLLTGHTGFKGSWIALWLADMGAKVTGVALAPVASPAMFNVAEVGRGLKSIICDICDAEATQAAVGQADPEIAIHMAAQALVRQSLRNPLETFAINVAGTANVLEALRKCRSLQAILVITSDKVYAHEGRKAPFNENDTLGGKDPYSASKAAAEIVTRAYAESYFSPALVRVATARAGNIIGGGDFAEDRLVPDTIRSVSAGERLVLRHPEATRPWQHVLDCIAGYLLYAEALSHGGQVPRSLNFGPDPSVSVTVSELAETLLTALGQPPAWDYQPIERSIEMATLTLDSTLARQSLGWRPRLPDLQGVDWTANWYRAFASGADVRALTLQQLVDYRALARECV